MSQNRRAFFGLSAATALAAFGEMRAARAGATCRGEGHPCQGNQKCCGDLVCVAGSGSGAAKRCAKKQDPTCAGEGEQSTSHECCAGLIVKDGVCVTPESCGLTGCRSGETALKCCLRAVKGGCQNVDGNGGNEHKHCLKRGRKRCRRSFYIES